MKCSARHALRNPVAITTILRHAFLLRSSRSRRALLEGLRMADAAYDASLGEAYSLLSRRELGKATESFRILLKQTPGSAEVNFGLGKALARQKLSAGETYLRKAIDLDP